MSVYRYDAGELGKPERLDNGFVRCDGRITRVGVFPYLNRDGSIRRELRLPAEVFKADSLASFEDATLTNDHPPQGQKITSRNTARYQVGHVRDIRRDGEYVAARVLITDGDAIAVAEKGKRQLSCGYRCDLEEKPGITSGIDGVPDGLKYDCVQRNIRGNHIAIVARGRAGADAALRLDADTAVMYDERTDAIDYRNDSVEAGLIATPTADGSPRNRFGSQSSKGFAGDYAAAWRSYFAGIAGGSINTDASAPIRETGRRIAMIAAGMDKADGLTDSAQIGPRIDRLEPVNFPSSPADYDLTRWDAPEDQGLTDADMRLDCSDLDTIKKAATAEIKWRIRERQKRDRADVADTTEGTKTMKINVDGVDIEFSEQAGQAYQKAAARADELAEKVKKAEADWAKDTARADKAEEDRDAAIKARNDAADPKVVAEAVKARVGLVQDASKILGEKDADGKAWNFDGMTEAVVCKLSPKAAEKIDSLEGDARSSYLAARYDQAIESYEPPQGNAGLSRVRIQAAASGGDHTDADSARARMIKENQDRGRRPLGAQPTNEN
jgi:hypothetical protein